MNGKPAILGQKKLTPYYARYRQMLCRDDETLDQRLRAGGVASVSSFWELVEQFDALFFDAFGVLNVGRKPIPGAAATLKKLKAMGKRYRIVSNNASQSPEKLELRFKDMGFEIAKEEIVSSGMAVIPFMATTDLQGKPYYMVGTADSRGSYAPNPEQLLVSHDGNALSWRDAESIIMCSNRDYYVTEQREEVDTLLQEKQCPILLANPDLVAPESDGRLNAVAGYTTMELSEQFDMPIIGCGKPFTPIFTLALSTLDDSVDPEKILMVGDTLDTDILGGAAMGFKTCLTLSGVYQGEEETLPLLYEARGIRPDYVVASIA
ncbi:MAG: HAD-IIA family hydrolase [Magnetococcales bacterium]|nr:HAD-IIA family hydrolase [Magnetococcales bacterium]